MAYAARFNATQAQFALRTPDAGISIPMSDEFYIELEWRNLQTAHVILWFTSAPSSSAVTIALTEYLGMICWKELTLIDGIIAFGPSVSSLSSGKSRLHWHPSTGWHVKYWDLNDTLVYAADAAPPNYSSQTFRMDDFSVAAYSWNDGYSSVDINYVRVVRGAPPTGAPQAGMPASGTVIVDYEFENDWSDSGPNGKHLTPQNGPTFVEISQPGPPARIDLMPDTLSLVVGQQTTLTAKAYDSNNNEVTGQTFQFSTDPSKLRIDVATPSAVTVTALAVGTAQVTATLNTLTDSTSVSIISAPPAVPTGLASIGYDNVVIVVWNPPDPGDYYGGGAITYKVYKSSTSNGQDLSTPYLWLTEPGFCDAVPNGSTAYYVVKAVRDGVESLPSAEIAASPRAFTLPTPSPQVAAILGEYNQLGSAGNTAWFDYVLHVKGHDYGAAFPADPPGYQPLAGTISVTNGSNVITGTGTQFTDLTPILNAGGFILIHQADGIHEPYWITSIQSDTQLTVNRAYTGATASGLQYGAATDNEANDYLNANYYDQALTQYVNYYRTGDATFLTYARKIADSWWRAYPISSGNRPPSDTGFGLSPRQVSLGGLMLRALDGRPEYWNWIAEWCRYHYDLWIGQRINYPTFYYGIREAGYVLLYCAWLAQVHPDATVRAEFQSKALAGGENYAARLQYPDGSFRYTEDAYWIGHATQPFHEGLMLNGLRAAYEVTNSQVILEAFLRGVTSLCAEQYDAQTPARLFQYYIYLKGDEIPFEHYGANPRVFDDVLNLRAARCHADTVVGLIGYAYKLTGAPKYRLWAEQVFKATYSRDDGLYCYFENSPKLYNQTGRSAYYYEACRTLPSSTTPVGVTDLRVRSTSNTAVRGTFKSFDESVTDFVVEYKVGNGSWAQLTTLASTAREFTDSGLSTGQERFYRVIARNGATAGAPSNAARVVVGEPVLTTLAVPSAATLSIGQTITVPLTALDQFGNPLNIQRELRALPDGYVSIDQAAGAITGLQSTSNLSPDWPLWVAYTTQTQEGAIRRTNYQVTTVVPNQLPSNQLPTCSITSPSDGATYIVGQAVMITASATDPDGTIARVEFFVNGQKVDEDTTAPYNTAWTPTMPGTYTLSARATDNSGAATDAAAITVTVNAATAPAPPRNVRATVVLINGKPAVALEWE